MVAFAAEFWYISHFPHVGCAHQHLESLQTNMSTFERHHVSRLIPSNVPLLTALLVAVAVTNSAVRVNLPESYGRKLASVDARV